MTNFQTASKQIRAFVNLARMRIGIMVAVSAAIGYVLSYKGQFHNDIFWYLLMGTGLLSNGACTLNCYIEREQDALMPRTCNRPLPSGVISPPAALVFGISQIAIGGILLFCKINALSCLLGMAAVVIYLAIYTPLKRLSWLNTSVGAVPGAIPPLMGWAAARGHLDIGGWILFAMLFIWQHTHFLPIAWLYRNDYQAAGFRMLPVLEVTGEKTFRLTIATAIILLPISLMLCEITSTGWTYCISAIVLGLLLIMAGVRLWRNPSRAGAHAVLYLSLWYLPVILAAVILDRWGAHFGTSVHYWLETAWQWT